MKSMQSFFKDIIFYLSFIFVASIQLVFKSKKLFFILISWLTKRSTARIPSWPCDWQNATLYATKFY